MINIIEKDLTKLATIRTVAKAKYFVQVNSIDDIKEALSYANDNKLRIVIIGNGTNILFTQQNYNDRLFIKLGKALNQIFIFDYMSYFISGIMFYKLFHNEKSLKLYLVLILAFGIGFYLNHYENAYMLFVIYGVFILLAKHKLNWIAQKPLIFLGSISYALYLVHQNMGYIILNYTFSINISPWIGTIIATIISIIVATLITFYIEKQSMRYFKNKYKVNEEKILTFLKNKKYLSFLVDTKKSS